MVCEARDDLIFDLGAHKGEDSAFYLKLGYRVVAVEAHPGLARGLRARFEKEIAKGNYVLINAAIGDSPGHVRFFVNQKISVWGTLDPTRARLNKRLGAPSSEIIVDQIRFESIVRDYGCPFYLKTDIEGADMLCITGLGATECRPRYISIESTKTSWRGLLHEFNALESLGYNKFKVVAQVKHKGGEFRDRMGQLVNYEFEPDASGPFGENLDGPWLSRKAAVWRYILIFLMYKTVGDKTIGRMVLRRIPFVRRVLRYVLWYDTHAMRQ